MQIISVKDEIEFDGENVIIRKRGAGNMLASGLNGDRSISIHSINAIQMKPGGWVPGYIQFSYAGSKAFDGGLIAATQDPDAFVFSKSENSKIVEMKMAIEQAMRDSKRSANKSPLAPSLADELGKLSALRNSGALTQDEFDSAKAKLISSI